MHIVIAIISVLGAAALLIVRLGMIARSGREIGDAAGDIMGAARRAKIRRQATASPLTTLEDPRDAVMALLVAITKTEGDLTDHQARFIERLATEHLGFSNGKEALAHGRWLCQEAVDPGLVIQRVYPLVSTACTEEQKLDTVEMLEQVASIGSEPSPIQLQSIQKLKHDLGLRKTM